MPQSARACYQSLDDAASARAGDAYSIETLGVPGIVLMEHAGRGALDDVRRQFPGQPLAVLCGPGNNGGDGFVFARHAHLLGHRLHVLFDGSLEERSQDAHIAAAAWGATLRARPAASTVCGALDPQDIGALPDDVVLVDALFGTGLSRPLGGAWTAVLDAVAAHRGPVVALDLPSGHFADGRAPAGPTVRAVRTLTFGRAKIAHFAEPAAADCGEVVIIDAGLAYPDAPAPARRAVLSAPAARTDTCAHKGAFGHVAVAMGSPALSGASLLACRGALRTGAGKVSLLVAHDADVAAPPEVMLHRLPDKGPANLAAYGALVLGPGLSREALPQRRAAGLMSAAAARCQATVVDADGLFLPPAWGAEQPVVFTPHPGEAAQLLALDTAAVQADRVKAAHALLEHLGAGLQHVVILKGAAPVIVGAGQSPVVIDGFCPALAVGGSGDVLSGIIAALLASGASAFDAAVRGTLLHQHAGAWLTQRARRGHLASDIADAVPLAAGALP